MLVIIVHMSSVSAATIEFVTANDPL